MVLSDIQLLYSKYLSVYHEKKRKERRVFGSAAIVEFNKQRISLISKLRKDTFN